MDAEADGDAEREAGARSTRVLGASTADVTSSRRYADAQTGLAHVKDAEAVVGDARGRCILGRVGATDFQPGFKLERARYALAAPAGKGDALMGLLSSQRTLDLTVELGLAPAPKEADVKKWIAQGRAWMSTIAAPIRAQFAGNPMLDVYVDMLALLGERGFAYEIAGTAVRFSWRTDRVPRAELDALEKRFAALLAR